MNRHILVVDASEKIRNLFSFLLKGEGFKVSTASNAVEALTDLSYQGNKINLVITDINTEHMDGFSLIKAIRDIKNHAKTPIIILSTETAEESIRHAMSLGADMYITKPVQPERIVRNIKMLLTKSSTLPIPSKRYSHRSTFSENV